MRYSNTKEAHVRKAERWEYILTRLGRDGDLDVNTLAEEMDVSPATARRDLQELHNQHLLSRVHGGATSSGIFSELPLRHRIGQQQEGKQWIATAAVDLIEPGMAVGLTGGTTMAAVARELMKRRLKDVTIVTNSLAIAYDFSMQPGYNLVMTGGFIRPASLELVGPFADATIEKVNLDVTVVGVDGITAAAGLTLLDELEARTNSLLLQRARNRVVVADHSKLGRAAFAQVCPLSDVDVVITDPAPDGTDEVAAIRAHGTKVILAEAR
jgi:DeoR family transcriptional regulator of aga operon